MTDQELQREESGQPRDSSVGSKSRLPTILLWSLLLSMGLSIIVTYGAAIAWCGVGGCGGGYFPVSRDPLMTIAFLVFAAIVASSPLFLVPWSRIRNRLIAMGAFALVYGVVGFRFIIYLTGDYGA